MKRELCQASALLAAILLTSCAGPLASGVRYSPPSAAPVRDWITNAQGHAAKAKASVETAAKAPDLEATRLPLQIAGQEIDALTDELLKSQTALKDFEKKVFDMTTAANLAIDDKNAAITARDRETAKAKRIAKREHYFFLLLSAALIWIFRTPLLGLLKLLLALVNKIPI